VKKILLYAFLLFILAGCVRNTNDENKWNEAKALDFLAEQDENLKNDDILVLSIYPRIVFIDDIPDNISIIITNNSQTEQMIGRHHAIEYFDGNDWIRTMPPQIFSDAGFIVSQEEALEMRSSPLSQIENLVAGKYRIIHSFIQEYIYAIFFILD